MRLKNKVAIVTGGSQGIGEAICLAYAKEGARVAIVNKNNPKTGKQLEAKILENGGEAFSITCDVTQPGQVSQLVDTVISKYGRVDILVNNLGLGVFKLFEDHTLEDFDFSINTNLKSAFVLAQKVVPYMKKQQYGKIIFVSSIAANLGFSSLSAYTATKGALRALVKTLVAELAQYHINVNLLTPGSTDTPGNATFVNNPVVSEKIKQNTPTKTGFMKPEDLAGPAVFLASDESSAVHGLDLVVDNGVSAVSM